jgi:predicted kinase
MTDTASIHLVCGSTGAGKTTYAMALAERLGAVRLSIDEWMTTLFWMDSPQPIQFEWTIARIDRVEAQMWATAVDIATRGVPTVLDLGLSKAEHRRKFFDLSQAAGLAAQLHFVDVPKEERWRRVQKRNTEKGETFRMEVTREMFDFVDEQLWEPPADAEMAAYAGIRTGRSV